MRTQRKHLSLAVGALLFVGAATGVGVLRGHEAGALSAAHAADAPPPAAEVDVATVLNRSVTDWQSYSGRLEAVDRVDVRPLVSGTIVAVHFADGAIVKKGDPLFTIDPRPYRAEVDRAAAQLAAANARALYASTDAARADRLLADNAIARRDYDEKQNASREAAAGVKAAQAALEAAQVNLGYTNVVAPVAGRVSRAELTLGNVVSAGANAPLLTTLVSVSPIYASFDVDEQTYLQYLGRDRNTKVPVALGLANESGYSRRGAITSVDNRLDTSSGTIRVRATIDNGDGALVPGLYARVKVGGGTAHPAILIDDAALGTDQAKKYVLVVDAANKVQYREVQPGPLHDGLREITSGLAAGERIVVNGIQRARPGDSVAPHAVDMAAAKPAA
ncbi:efflux RND transporter periplasmic adaptor subunit [Paraburkholderia caballeronis]|uniref:Membrane fusion protein, multidrug efflux system n=1 Tax=Paraburkholderia caballeronis TaxID=416943 RepID=A0A1H7FXX4_9BURK|nr:efflux RND transporter periplasmic adaptor subunit [Paraburkholderia caballeronis]PXW24799.1 multidrug efflux system membrane fusion protein [Paraburkholderia caballeronis]PXX00529.1 multidrug efflux system membrane fusion protein [Paraburkholderia caballeronis]RAJ98592.1 multidrug efflux system membrane fusion protein [Paraburkholderia caballeronis]TDV16586.1 multidrug efflux system membrane fusion protein [Paraburkholderia caballeronis]TDV18982.1 multidrug efflux system membrane fusion pr